MKIPKDPNNGAHQNQTTTEQSHPSPSNRSHRQGYGLPRARRGTSQGSSFFYAEMTDKLRSEIQNHLDKLSVIRTPDRPHKLIRELARRRSQCKIPTSYFIEQGIDFGIVTAFSSQGGFPEHRHLQNDSGLQLAFRELMKACEVLSINTDSLMKSKLHRQLRTQAQASLRNPQCLPGSGVILNSPPTAPTPTNRPAQDPAPRKANRPRANSKPPTQTPTAKPSQSNPPQAKEEPSFPEISYRRRRKYETQGTGGLSHIQPQPRFPCHHDQLLSFRQSLQSHAINEPLPQLSTTLLGGLSMLQILQMKLTGWGSA